MLILLARLANLSQSGWGSLFSLLNLGYWNDNLSWRDNTNWTD